MKLHAILAQKNDVDGVFFCQFAEMLLTEIDCSQI